MLEDLKKQVLNANQGLAKLGLAPLTWGNVSGFDRGRGLMVIKPSGVSFADLSLPDMVVVDRKGRVVEGSLNPSSDTATHQELYKVFKEIGGIVHCHSPYATMFAQAERSIPCLGTTHADLCRGDIPLTRRLTKEEVEGGYEINTGKAIIELFSEISPLDIPAALAAGHGPFAWGRSPAEALEHAAALEAVAKLAWGTLLLKPEWKKLPSYVAHKHYSRKHGPEATYGQDGKRGRK